MIGYLTKIFQSVYEQFLDFINNEADYLGNRRLARFEQFKRSGLLEVMCGSEIEIMFGITREFPDNEPV